MANFKLTLLGFCLVIASAIARNPICSLPKVTGLCRAHFTRYYFNSATQKCEKFVYGGCFGNDNNFDTLEECNSFCLAICLLPKDTGPCRAHFIRYYFNSATQKCEQFVYGGCRGNANNFDTVEKCISFCLVDNSKGERDSCKLIPDIKLWCGFKGISFLCPHLCGLCEKPKY